MSFAEKLAAGQLGEGRIAKWWAAKGYSVLPAYQVEMAHGKGPRLYTAARQLISPDLLVFKGDRVLWCEAKSKHAFTWHRLSRTWQTGIDLLHWRHYLEVAESTPFPVWLFFLHHPNGTAKDTPAGMISPCGLFGNEISHLRARIHHQHENHGPAGMVYWELSSLKKIASYQEL